MIKKTQWTHLHYFNPNEGIKGSDKVYLMWMEYDTLSNIYTVKARYGRRGSTARNSPDKKFGSEYQAGRFYYEQKQSKLNKGYSIVDERETVPEITSDILTASPVAGDAPVQEINYEEIGASLELNFEELSSYFG